MARCDEGYLCDVCGRPVEAMEDSDLYLRYILGEISTVGELTGEQERHIRCNPVQAQFIVDPAFEPIHIEGVFDKRELDAADVRQREERVTTAWKRLQQVRAQGLTIEEYPLSSLR